MKFDKLVESVLGGIGSHVFSKDYLKKEYKNSVIQFLKAKAGSDIEQYLDHKLSKLKNKLIAAGMSNDDVDEYYDKIDKEIRGVHSEDLY